MPITAPVTDATLTLSWYDDNYVPPRCRKPRWAHLSTTAHVANLPNLTSDDAPIVFHIADTKWRTEYDLREWGNWLWRHHTTGFTPGANITNITCDRLTGPGFTMTDTELAYALRNAARAAACRYVIIDGDVWEATAEPVYVVTVSNSISSTSIQVNIDAADTVTDRYPHGTVFSAADTDAMRDHIAVLAADADADAPGNHVFLPEPDTTGHITVLDPNAVTVRVPTPTDRDLRGEFTRAARDLTRALTDSSTSTSATRAWDNLTGLKALMDDTGISLDPNDPTNQVIEHRHNRDSGHQLLGCHITNMDPDNLTVLASR